MRHPHRHRLMLLLGSVLWVWSCVPAHADVMSEKPAGHADARGCEALAASQQQVCREAHRPATAARSTSAQNTALERENHRYQQAVAACKRLPVSEWNTCIDLAGQDSRVAAVK